MTIRDAHNRLSLSLGDSTNNALSITDGVRFTAQMRSDYLHRAMQSILQSAVASVAMMPRLQAVDILTKLFPSHTTVLTQIVTSTWTNTIQFGATRLPLYIYSIRFDNTVSGISVPVPIKTPYQTNALLNSRNVQACDMFAVFHKGVNNFNPTPTQPVIELHKNGNQYSSGTLSVYFLPEPVYPSTTTGIMNLDFDPIYDGKILSLATYYGLLDSQDFDGQASQVLQAVAGPQVVIQPQGK